MTTVVSGSTDHGGRIFAMARGLGLAPEQIMDFSASINPLGPPAAVRQVLADAYDLLIHYPDNDATELTAALAGYHGLAAAEICVANGSTELICLLPRLIKGGRRVLIIAPPFSEYARSFAGNGWEVEYFDLLPGDGFSLPLAPLAERLAGGFDLLVLANPGNPTGRLYQLGQVEEVLRLCRKQGTFLVLDEAFMDFCEEESAKKVVIAGGGLILRSMTKFFAIPGLRLGYAIAAPEVIAAIAAIKEPWSVNTLAQIAGVAALSDPDYCIQTRELINAERAWLSESLGGFPGLKVFPSAANYLLVASERLPAVTIAGQLQQQGILIRDCANFRGLGEGYFRVAVKGWVENEKLRHALAGVLGS